MSYNVPTLDLDPTGTNVSNRIIAEPHSLSDRPTRSIAPQYGAFFSEGLLIQDGARVLTRGQDFQIVELHQEATLKYGKEICSVILIINNQVSSNVTVTYQALGGHYAYSDKTIADLYQSVINDNRPVDWSNIFNKPTEFNPTIHRHLLDDVYGFEPVVDYLERIKRAITMGQSGIVLEIVNSLLSKFKCDELPAVIPSNKLIQYDALLYFLSRRKILNNIWVDRKECTWYKGNSYAVQVDTSGYPVGTRLYWEFYKSDNTSISLFTNKSGSFLTNGSIKEFNVYVPSAPNLMDSPIYIGVKENVDDTEYKAVTYTLDIKDCPTTLSAYGFLLFNFQDQSDHDLFIADYDTNEERRIYYQATRW